MRALLNLIRGPFPSPPSAVPKVDPAATHSAELRDVIEAAQICLREGNDDGPRVAVISSALRGAFIYSREEADRRIRLAFPELSAKAVARGVRHLESRVIVSTRPRAQGRRNNWVHGWKDETDETFYR